LALLVVVVSCLALTPKPLEGFESGLDKVGHLGFLTSRGTRTALLFGLLAFEVLQVIVPSRSSEWGDMVADGIGIGVGIGLAAFVLRFGLRQR
jgi:hypothetical protein